jgi:hypothetical protein
MNEGLAMKRTRPTSPTLPDLDPNAARRLLLAALGGQPPEDEQAPEPEAPEIHLPEAEGEAPVPKLAFTVAEFCKAHSISLSTYRRLKLAGKGPVEMEIMADVRISVESAAEWRRSREPVRSNGSGHE